MDSLIAKDNVLPYDIDNKQNQERLRVKLLEFLKAIVITRDNDMSEYVRDATGFSASQLFGHIQDKTPVGEKMFEQFLLEVGNEFWNRATR
jgi:hypothetical protein